MRIFTSNHKRAVDVKDWSIWTALFSQAMDVLSDDDKEFLQYAIEFLKTGVCVADDAQITARQLELTKRRFVKNPKSSPLAGITHFATSDGKDLMDEAIDLLKYADKHSVDVLIER